MNDGLHFLDSDSWDQSFECRSEERQPNEGQNCSIYERDYDSQDCDYNYLDPSDSKEVFYERKNDQ